MTLTFPQLENPFQWANKSTVKTNFIGALVAFWCSLITIGTAIQAAQEIDVGVVAGLLLYFYLCSVAFSGVVGVLSRTMSRKALLLVGLGLMTAATVPIIWASSFGLFALLYMMMGIGYASVISVTGHLHYDFLNEDDDSLCRGRSMWGSINHVASLCGFVTSLLLLPEQRLMWLVVALVALVSAIRTVLLFDEEVAVKEQPWIEPDTEVWPFYPQLLTKDKRIHFSWSYVLVVAGSLAVRMWPVFYLDKWVAIAMITAMELTVAITGLPQVRGLQWMRQTEEVIRQQLTQRITFAALVAFTFAIMAISTNVTVLCVIGAALIGIVLRVAAYVELVDAQQKKRGAYTFFLVTGMGQCAGCMVAMVSMSVFAFVLLPFALGSVAYHWRLVKQM